MFLMFTGMTVGRMSIVYLHKLNTFSMPNQGYVTFIVHHFYEY